MREYIAGEMSIMPPMAPKESCSAALPASAGLISSITASAKVREVAPSFSRPKRGAISSMDCMNPARTVEGAPPVIITNSHTSTRQIRDERLFLPIMSCKKPTRKATCRPETATTWISPEVRIFTYWALS